MSASDTALMHDVIERLEKLEAQVKELTERAGGKELQQELYGEQPDHSAEREARRGPGRPPSR